MFQSRCRDSFDCDLNIVLCSEPRNSIKVSVPLPGFIWLRLENSENMLRNYDRFQSRCRDSFDCDLKVLQHRLRPTNKCFSPVAGIHLIATLIKLIRSLYIEKSFSPVAGIHLIATLIFPCTATPFRLFQSRCRDSFDCDSMSHDDLVRELWVSVPLPGFIWLRPVGVIACRW